MKLNRIMAVFKKTCLDVSKNKKEMFLYFLFPIMTYIFWYVMPDQKIMFAVLYVPMHILMVSTSMMAGIMAEEKDKGTLRSLILANVKPMEYFIGVGSFIILSTLISSLLFIPILDITGMMYFRFILIVLLGTLCSITVGATVGVIAENQMNANAIVSPIAIVLGMLPMFGQISKGFSKVTSVLYTHVISSVISSLEDPIKIKYFVILAINFIICIVIFNYFYKKRRLD